MKYRKNRNQPGNRNDAGREKAGTKSDDCNATFDFCLYEADIQGVYRCFISLSCGGTDDERMPCVLFGDDFIRQKDCGY